MKNSAIKPNDVLLNITGASLGRTCVVPQSFSKGNLSQHVCIIRLNHDINPYLVHTVLSQPKSLHELLKTQTGGGKEGLNFQAVRAFKLTLPNNEEQQKIAGFLGVVDERISGLQKKVELLQKYKKGMMQAIFSQKIRFKPVHRSPDCRAGRLGEVGDSNGKDYPAWQKKKLGEVFIGTKGSGLSWDKITHDGKNKCILYGELYTKYPEKIEKVISHTHEDGGVLSKTNDLLLPCSTTTTGIDLANATALNESGVRLGGDISVLRFKENGSNLFYAYYLTHFMKHKLAAYGQGSTIVHMYYSHFMNMRIVEPHIEEQQKIADFLTSIDEKIEVEERKLDQTKKFKKALLQQMFV